MVTSKRRIECDEDKFGNYELSDSYISTEREYNDILQERTYLEPEEYVEKEEIKESRAVGPEMTVEPRKMSISELMPSVARNSVQQERGIRATAIIRDQKLTSKAKVALVVYMSLILAVVAGVIATGAVVSSVSAEISQYESIIANQEETLLDCENMLATLADQNAVENRANALGMKKIGETNTYKSLIEKTVTPEENNVFDEVRDWLNAIFGG